MSTSNMRDNTMRLIHPHDVCLAGTSICTALRSTTSGNADRGRRIRAGVLVACCAALLVTVSGCNLGKGGRGVSPVGGTIDVSMAEMHLDDAELALTEGDDEAALEAFAQAIAENPRLFRAHMGMAQIYQERGEHDKALKPLQRAVEINPRNYEANYFLGFTLHVLDRISEAIRAYRRALSIDPDSHEANLNIATAYLQSGQPVEALPFAEAAARLQSDHGPTQVNLGSIYAALGRHDDAVVRYQNAMELMEPSAELILNLVESLKYEQRYQEMVHALNALLRLDPSPAAYERLGFAQFRLRKFDDSEAAYRAAIDLDEDYYPAMNGLGVILLNRWLQSNRSDLDAHFDAVTWLRKSIVIERDQPRIIELLSRYGR